MDAGMIATDRDVALGHVGGLPIRNLWLLMLYASQLYRHMASTKRVSAEENPDDIPDLVAEILAHEVENRLRRNLSYGYRSQQAILNRVRGRINVLETTTRQLLSRGAVACRFDQLTVDTPRNQYVRSALEAMGRVVQRPVLAHRCRTLSINLDRVGVSKRRPSRAELTTERYGRHDAGDRLMVEAARLAFELLLPTETTGSRMLKDPARGVRWLRDLYEKAIGGFYDVVLSPRGWRVQTGRYLAWPIELKTGGIDDILPAMQTDIVLEHVTFFRRIVIDTKFTSILTKGRFREGILKSGHLYQLYAYLRSQEDGDDPVSEHAIGLLLHPTVGEAVDEVAVIQGHPIRFATVDLAASAPRIREQLVNVIDFSHIASGEGS